jgi:hypothetical protein
MNIEIKVTKDHATAAINRLMSRLEPAQAAAAMGPVLQRLLQHHFRSLPRNQHGWPSTHFWAAAAHATSWTAHPDGVLVSVNKVGVRQRWKGGPIKPVWARALAIPATAETYGKLPGDFNNLKAVRFLNFGALVRKTDKGASPARMRIMFWIVKGVNQDENPAVMPTRRRILITAKTALQFGLKRQ